MTRILAAAAAFMIMLASLLQATAAHAAAPDAVAPAGAARAAGVSAGVQLQDDPTPTGAAILSPATGSDVAGSFQLEVSRGTVANLTVWLDGSYFTNNPGTTDTVDFNLYLDGIAGGETHLIEVGECAAGSCATTADGTVTSSINVTAYPADGIDVTSASSSGFFSPDGDGVQDTVTIAYTTEVPGTVRATVVRNSDGATVLHYDLGAKPIGAASFVWTGKNVSGRTLRSDSYQIIFSVTASGGSTSNDWTDVVLDTVDPVLGSLAQSTTTVFPRKDTYRDKVSFTAELSENASLVQLRITTSSGRAVRTLSATSVRPGKVALIWDGLTAGGAMAAAGTYAFRWYARDPSGNAWLSAAASIGVDQRILSGRTATRTLTPSDSQVSTYTGACSRLVSNPNGWTGGAGYYSLWRKYNGKSCPNVAHKDLVYGNYKLVVPAAPKFGAVKVAAVGKSHAYASTATLTLLRNSTTARSGAVRTLDAASGTYWTAAKTFTDLGYGRTVRWRVVTTGGNHYDVRAFKVTWTYYILVN